MKVEFYYPQQARVDRNEEIFKDVSLALAKGTWFWDLNGDRYVLRIPWDKTRHRSWWVAWVDTEPDEATKQAIVDLVRLQWGVS